MKKIFFLLLVFASFSSTAQVNADSLWGFWSDERLPSETRIAALKLIDIDDNGNFRFGNNLDTAIYHAKLIVKIAENENLKISHIEGLINQAYLYLFKNDITNSREISLQGLALAEEIDDKLRIGKNCYNLGIGYLKAGDFSNGFPYFQRAEKLFRDLDEKMLQALSLGKMAFLYSQLNDVKSSNEYLTKAINIRQQLLLINDNPMNRFVINGMEQTLRMQKATLDNPTDSIGQEKAQLEIKLAMDSLKKMAIASSDSKILNPKESKASKEIVRNQTSIAIEDIEKNEKGIQEEKIPTQKSPPTSPINNEIFQAENYVAKVHGVSAKASTYLENGDTLKAIPFLEKALSLGLETKDINVAGWASSELYKSYRSVGRYSKSLKMLEKSIIFRDSVFSLKNTNALFKQKTDAEYEKQKALDNAQNEKLVAIETQKKKYQQKLFLAASFALFLISILAFFNFNRYKETKRQKAIIEKQKKKVEQSEKYKEQFLANMSHEIRTPMHAISGMVKILERNEHPPSQDVFLDIMKTSSDNLVVILNDVLDLSKIEAGKLDIENIPLSPKGVIGNVVQILKYKAEEKGLRLDFKVDEAIPEIVMGDPTRLNQILTNLVGNAIKFTEKGSVNILLEKENEYLRFSVLDTGIGIPKEKIESIFGAFEQAKDSTTRQYGGTGLGLSITKQLVELQQGNIWVKSEVGNGSAFFVELPLVQAPVNSVSNNLITEEKLRAMAASLQGLSVLIAEDNPFNQMIARDDLSFYLKDIKIDIVENGALAVEKFKTGTFDFILMDVQMPEMNGFEATQAIRSIEAANETTTRIPIIAMTASLLKSEIESCYSVGMNDYIPKPYKIEELIGPIYKGLKQPLIT